MRTFAQKPKAPQQATPAKSTARGRAHLGRSHEVDSILHLQRTIGNQAGLRLLEVNMRDVEENSTAAEIARFGHDFSRIPIHPPSAGMIQSKLAINKPGDQFEQEADRVAEKVMRMSEPSAQPPGELEGEVALVQTKPVTDHPGIGQQPEEEEEVELVQAKEVTDDTPEVEQTTQAQFAAMGEKAVNPCRYLCSAFSSRASDMISVMCMFIPTKRRPTRRAGSMRGPIR